MSDWDDIASLSAYTQAYPDLLLWLSETGDRRALHEHLKVRSPMEGRVLPGSLHAPGDWSDELAHRHVCQLASDLWRLGTLETTYFRAQIETPNGFDANGRLSENSSLKETT